MNIIFYPRFILLHLGLIFSIWLQAKAFGFYMCIFWISFNIIMGQNMKLGAVCFHKCRRYQKSTFPLVIYIVMYPWRTTIASYISVGSLSERTHRHSYILIMPSLKGHYHRQNLFSCLILHISCYRSKTPALISSFIVGPNSKNMRPPAIWNRLFIFN